MEGLPLSSLHVGCLNHYACAMILDCSTQRLPGRSSVFEVRVLPEKSDALCMWVAVGDSLLAGVSVIYALTGNGSLHCHSHIEESRCSCGWQFTCIVLDGLAQVKETSVTKHAFCLLAAPLQRYASRRASWRLRNWYQRSVKVPDATRLHLFSSSRGRSSHQWVSADGHLDARRCWSPAPNRQSRPRKKKLWRRGWGWGALESSFDWEQLDSPREPWNLKLEEASLQLGLVLLGSQMSERLETVAGWSHGTTLPPSSLEAMSAR
jgi:hypothetical protein